MSERTSVRRDSRLVVRKDLRVANGRDEVECRTVGNRIKGVVLIGLALKWARDAVD